jgi:hypothetical protein
MAASMENDAKIQAASSDRFDKLLLAVMERKDAAHANGTSSLAGVKEVVGAFKELRELAPGADDSSKSMLERVSERPLTAAAEKLVDKLLSSPAAPAQAPPPTGEAPPATAAPKLPPGSKLLSAAEVEALKQRRAQVTAPPAPKAADVLPQAVEKKP